MNELSLWVAFTAGILSFLSPCVLPLVPGYISFISGVSLEDLRGNVSAGELVRHSGLMSIVFVLGFSSVFVALGATATSLGSLMGEHIRILTRIAGVIVVLFGLHLVGLLKVSFLHRHKKMDVTGTKRGVFGAFFVGLAFAFGWTPCIGPILGSMIALAATEETVKRGTILLAFYSLGIGIPFILAGFAIGGFTKFFEKYKKFLKWGQIASGMILIVLGGLIFFDNLGTVVYGIQDLFTRSF